MMEPKWSWILVIVFFLAGWCTGCWEHERTALLQLKPFFNDPYSLSSWDDAKGLDCCKWERVECSITDRRVIGLSLNSTTLQHHWYLNASLFLPFEELRSLYLNGNEIAGCVDKEEPLTPIHGKNFVSGFAKLASALGKLEVLDLSYNYFNDSIVSSLTEFSSLKSLYLAGNQFTGSNYVKGFAKLSSALGKLEVLDLSYNYFNDSIVSSLTEFPSLKSLYLAGNQFTGLNHTNGFKWLSRLRNLETLDLAENSLKNNFLLHVGGLSSLKTLTLQGNRLEGSLDIQELNNLTNLRHLDLSNNGIESFRSFQGNGRQPMINLEALDLSSNFFQNSTFASISGLPNLKSLYIRYNELQGSIDIKELNNFIKLKKLDMSENKIESFRSFQDNEKQLKLINLEDLDLSDNLFNNSILAMLSGFPNMKSLNLGGNQLKGSINIKALEALNGLEELDFSGNELHQFVAPKESRSLKKLEVAYLDGVFINATASLVELVETFPSVKTFFLRGNYLNKTLSSTQELHLSSNVEELLLDDSYLNNDILQSIGVLASLKTLSLCNCSLTGTLPTQGWCDLWNLEALDLSENALEGTLPSCLGNLSSLHYLDISDNQFVGNGASTSLGNLTLLRFVSLSKNLFQVPAFFISFANHSHLKVLLSDQNKLVEEPTSQTWLPKFQLKAFHMSSCTTKELHRELPKFLYYQYDLSIVDLSYNNFEGKIPSWLLENNTRLEAFFMMGNYFESLPELPSHPNLHMIDLSNSHIQGRIPMDICSTFPNLEGLNLSRNALEGNIPSCLGGLNTFLLLDLSYNQLSGRIPEELGNSGSLMFLRLSNNNLSGNIGPTIFSLYALVALYLDGNNFDGEIPSMDISTVRSSSLRDMDLSNNNLGGKLPRWIWNVSNLNVLALSNNKLGGPIPMELCYLDDLVILDLSKNNFSGPVPSCFSAGHIRHLHLSRNRLSGTLGSESFNISSLVTLDLSENHLSGKIPFKFGTVSALSVLLLKANYFTGEIPVQLCELQSLSIIDLSQNKLSGSIPSCLSNLTFEPNYLKSLTASYMYGIGAFTDGADYFGLTEFENENLRGVDGLSVDVGFETQMEEQVDYTTKKGTYKYKGHILEYMSGIDLSCNTLTGQIPLEIGYLSEIRSLNLSYNNLTGVVPSTFSKLKQIESLDLSHNNLIGRIPIQLMELNALAVFNVSYNNLSGSIPHEKAQFGTFDQSSYVGNPFLCGPPLHKNCTETDSPPTVQNASKGEEESCLVDKYVFRISFLVSYAIVLMAIAAILYINPYWRQAWFYFIELCITTCHLFIVDNLLEWSIFRRST